MVNGGSYVKETGQAHECFNFAPAELEDGRKVCLGYAQLTGGSDTKEPELHIEKIVGCNALKKEEFVDERIMYGRNSFELLKGKLLRLELKRKIN